MHDRFTLAAAFFLSLAATLFSPATAAQEFETRAKQAFMIDAETGTVLYAKDADTPFPPASLAKLMTMEVVFDALRAGRASLDDSFFVSVNAWRTGGAPSGTSTMFAEVRSSIRLEDLVKGAIVQSANDACIVIAEGMAGSEEAFSELMNQRARALGLTGSVFVNATGLPAEGQAVTARDLVSLARHLWRTYPEYYPIYSMPDFTWNGIRQRNRNPLLEMDIGADGLKTGYTEASGYAIVGSVRRGDRRLFAAMSGLGSDAERAAEARRLLDWGMRAFEKRILFPAGQVLGEASVFGGEKTGLALVAGGPVSLFVPVMRRDTLRARIVYQGPVEAPVASGTEIGTLRIWVGETLSMETPVYAAEDIGVGPLHRRALDAIKELLVGWIRQL
jgi:D-alanyl-D-alanine carboxypeptidase (penicillin-binding protein 5/6)